MKRRDSVLAFLAMVATAGPLPLRAQRQQAGRTYRVAIAHTSTPMATLLGPDPEHTLTREILHELRDIGYVEGRNLIFERRSAEGHPERYPQIFAELVRLNTDAIILPGGADQIRDALAATRTIPLLMTGHYGMVEAGFVASLSRPGGNITGLAEIPRSEFGPKMLQMFKEAVPGLRRVAVLTTVDPLADSMFEAAAVLGFKLLPVAAHPTDPEESFARIAQLRVDGLYVGLTGTNYAHRKQLGRMAYAARLPSIASNVDNVEAGGLMYYGSSGSRVRRLAHYIDRIFKGAKPGDLPMELPTTYELVINLKTAKAIGITIPRSVLLRADRVIE
jgi:putative ABC transport system substrate-binding protein